MTKPMGTFGSTSRRPPVVPVAQSVSPTANTAPPAAPPAPPTGSLPDATALDFDAAATQPAPPDATPDPPTSTAAADTAESAAQDDVTSGAADDDADQDQSTPTDTANTDNAGTAPTAEARPEPDRAEKPTPRRGRGGKAERKPRARSKAASDEPEHILVVVDGGQVRVSNPNLVVIDLDDARNDDTDPVALLDLMRQLRGVPNDELYADAVGAIQSVIAEKILGD